MGPLSENADWAYCYRNVAAREASALKHLATSRRWIIAARWHAHSTRRRPGASDEAWSAEPLRVCRTGPRRGGPARAWALGCHRPGAGQVEEAGEAQTAY